MFLREDIEKREYETLSQYAVKSAESKGRAIDEEKCKVRTEFQRDRDRIIHSKSFRRLMHKTQVFLSPEGDHFRTRLTHTLEVSQIARTISRGLGLNEDLTEAIALGHDLGHTPFGHSGESVLDQKHPNGFCHNEQSLRVVDILEGGNLQRRGMNLTFEVRNGIVCHTGNKKPITLEGQVVRFSDRIAYINHDIDDAIRSNVIHQNDLPKAAIEVLGNGHRDRINTLVYNIIENSSKKDEVIMSIECQEQMDSLRSFMFENVYYNNKVKKNEDLAKIEDVIFYLYDFFIKYPKELPNEMQSMIEEFGIYEVVKDYIAGMTDRYALNLYDKIKK